MAGKDAAEVDNTYFLLPVKILDHDGPLGTSFPIENRHLPQGTRSGPCCRVTMATVTPCLADYIQAFSSFVADERESHVLPSCISVLRR